ncbi:hypothetical protein RRG08_040775 [Elysia crispata]|uniref:Uncharacterized protein n=1 Tax=Elysia crispata TaxID=231223 RepID=A0AAE1EGJ7_9GAST|nr:hypothetical protein RRG08_040775 [Elysia crispata]
MSGLDGAQPSRNIVLAHHGLESGRGEAPQGNMLARWIETPPAVDFIKELYVRDQALRCFESFRSEICVTDCDVIFCLFETISVKCCFQSTVSQFSTSKKQRFSL